MRTVSILFAAVFLACPAAVRAGAFKDFFRSARASEDPHVRVEFYTKALDAWTPDDLDANKAIVLGDRAIAYSELNRRDLALADLNASLIIEPRRVQNLYNRGNTLLGLGQFDAAISDYNRVLELDPGHAAAYHNRGSIYKDKGNLDKALADLDRAVSLAPQDAKSLNMRANIHEGRKELAEALADFTAAISADPKYPDPLINRGALYVKEKKYAEAVADFDKVLQLDPSDKNGLNNMIATRHRMRDYAIVLSYLDRVAEPSAKDVLLRGLMNLRLGRWKEALKHVDRGLTLDPGNSFGLINRAEIDRKLKNPAKELADLDRAVEASSTTARPRAYRGEALLLRGRLKDAEADALKAAEINPGYPRAVALLGRMDFERGDYEAAAKRFDAALAIKADEDTALLGLAFTAFKLGKLDDARARWAQTLTLSPWLGEGLGRAENEGYAFTAKEAAVFKALSKAPAKPKKP